MATLDTVLDKLSGLFTKEFVVSSVPVLGFTSLHFAAAYTVFPATRRWIATSYLSDPTHNIVAVFATLLFVVVLTYVLSMLNSPLREVLEGKHWWEWLAFLFRQKYRVVLRALQEQELAARHANRAIAKEVDRWKVRLAKAIEDGKTKTICGYKGCGPLDRLLARAAWDRKIVADQIDFVVNDLCSQLATNNITIKGPDGRYTPSARKLDDDHGKLLQLMDMAIERWELLRVQFANEIQFQYAGQNVAPTQMGNIAAVANYYAYSRYSLNLEIFWTRLQKVIQSSDSFYGLLQDGKRQLDFVIALYWQTAFFTGLWGLLLPLVGGGPYLFLAVSLGGPTAMYMWYRVALRNYKSFSDLVRAAVDLYRLPLLKELHVPAPVNAEQERLIWQTLEQRLGYGERDNVLLQSS